MYNFLNVVGKLMLMIGVALSGIGVISLGVLGVISIWGDDGSFKMALDITITLFSVGMPLWIVGSFIAQSTD